MELERRLHFIAFNVPYPANYGGVIDIYYKLKSLYNSRIEIILHCYTYGRDKADILEQYCKEVHYYSRKSGLRHLVSPLPYIVSTRRSKELMDRLLADDVPILMEGLHSTWPLYRDERIAKRCIVRTHNIEHKYYALLANSERGLFKKLFLSLEAKKLKRYEPVLAKAEQIAAISTTDQNYLWKVYGKASFIPAFHANEEVHIQEGIGRYLLFHGNLAVPENEKALLYLLTKVLSKLEYPVSIAGKNPSKKIQSICAKFPHISLHMNPDDLIMKDLVSNAQINLLYTYQPTGLKLKLLHSLYSGRHCLANPLMLSGSGLDELCEIYTTPDEAIRRISELMDEPFRKDQIEKRIEMLQAFQNELNAQKLKGLLFPA